MNQDKARPANEPQDSVTPDKTPISSGAPVFKNILCIEDEHFISELYSRALRKAGYNVTVIVDGAEGLKEIQSNKYDIVLLDIMMPNMTGTQLLEKVRAGAPVKAKIIIATNLEQKEEVRAAIEKQADGYIVKAEVTPKQLVEFLSSFEPKRA